MKSVVLKDPQKQISSHSTTPGSSAGLGGRTTSKNSGPNDPEKIELKEKTYNFIAERIHQLDPQGYMEEIHSFWHFHWNSKDFALKIIAIADWACKWHSVGLHFPIPTFLHYLFNNFTGL